MNTMLHKGYTARVEYDERDNIFVGRILGIRNIISFHGETVKQLRTEFEQAIKDYLTDCKQQSVTRKSQLLANCCFAFHPKYMVERLLQRRHLERA